MTTLRFHGRAPYLHEMEGTHGSAPAVWILLAPDDAAGLPGPAHPIGATAVLDSGCERSTFDGLLCRDLGLDLPSGVSCTMHSTRGALQAYLHVVQIALDLSTFADLDVDAPELVEPYRMRVAFTLDPLRRNLLGRDFFEPFRVCFDEVEQSVYLGIRRRSAARPRPAELAA